MTTSAELSPDLIGCDTGLAAVLDDLRRVLGVAVNVLIEGESGTGKELIARRLHSDDPVRSGSPFVAVNCAALPEALLEAELFGYRRGVFTGADRDRDGVIMQADGGTLFLDEVAELPLPLQPKLLRVLQERAIRPLGASAEDPVDVRVVCATNRDLRACMRTGAFRADLFYRLAEFELHIPPLRQRRGDILPLTRHFLRRYAEDFGRQARPLSRRAAEWLHSRDWSENNVRELCVTLKRAVLRCDAPVIDLEHVYGEREDHAEIPSLGNEVERLGRHQLEDAMQRSDGNISAAARLLGMKRSTLFDRLRKLDIGSR